MSTTGSLGEVEFPIVDSHIHLYAETALENLNWTAELPKNHILKQQRSVNDYRTATKSVSNLLSGFIFVETDRRYETKTSDWTHPLQEISFFSRIANDSPIDGEGHKVGDHELAYAMIPWAPMQKGPERLGEYISAVEQVCHNRETFQMIRGFRFLLQNRPRGTMLAPDFVESMMLLHDRGYSFDLTIDCHNTGDWQISEAVQLATLLNGKDKMPNIILDHCCKPDLSIESNSSEGRVIFQTWADGMAALASFPGTFVKLSGLLSELATDFALSASPEQVVERIKPWTSVILEHFGPKRIMFGSDWPVCTVSSSEKRGWASWYSCVEILFATWQLKKEEKAYVWSKTAAVAYGLKLGYHSNL